MAKMLRVPPAFPYPRLTIREQVLRLHAPVASDRDRVQCVCTHDWFSADDWMEHRNRALRAAGERLTSVQ